MANKRNSLLVCSFSISLYFLFGGRAAGAARYSAFFLNPPLAPQRTWSKTRSRLPTC
jgi:hypothetical protein